MSRFNITIILACVLLGLLLWIVQSTVGEWIRQPATLAPQTAATQPSFDPALPVLRSGAELIGWMTASGLTEAEARSRLDHFRYWLHERGFPVADAWFSKGVGSLAALPPQLDTNDDAELMALAGAGNTAAAEKLSDRSVQQDPLAALEWLDQAIVNGSIRAMLRTADLLTTLGDPALANFPSDAVWQQALKAINSGEPPLERALAWDIAAVIAGGFPVLDARLADNIRDLTAQLNGAQLRNACNLAHDYVLDTAKARRARGGAVFSTERPVFAVSVAKPGTALPCDIPVQPLVDMTDCLTVPFVGPGPRHWQMYFCSPSRTDSTS